MAAGGLSSVANYAVYNTYMGEKVTLNGMVSNFVTGAVIAGLFYGADKLIGKGFNFIKDKVSSSANNSIKWPSNNGFDGKPVKETLQPGKRIDRFGYENGNYFAAEGTPYGMRSLPQGSNTRPYHVYEVAKPFKVKSGPTSPWFGEPGGGIQYKSTKTVQKLLDKGFIREVFN